jgi:spore maturation protein SpmA
VVCPRRRRVFKRIVDGTFESARVGVMEIALPLAGVMTLWLGILAIGEKAGAIDAVRALIAPFFSRIFPGVPRDHPANGLIVMNYSANFLGLDNAATPIGLKAMASLQELNPSKDEATDAQLMYLVLHTAGLTLIPVTVMAQRAILGAKDPSDIFIPTLIATFAGTLVAFIAVALRQRIRLLDPGDPRVAGRLTAFVRRDRVVLRTQLTRAQIQRSRASRAT